MEWARVGQWIKQNAGPGAALVGSLLTGNLPGAIAAGTALVASATGTDKPNEALATLQTNPETLLRLKQLAADEAASIREHIRLMEEARLKDVQAAHEQQQLTIREGDASADEYVRHTRPMMARQSWYSTVVYVVGFEIAKGASWFNVGASLEIAMVLIAPAAAYMGFRTADKLTSAIKRRRAA